jgi:uncharacterized membrane protein YfcA
MAPVEIIGLIVLGLFAGSLAAALGVGGGIIYVPMLVSVFAFTQHEAQGTSLAIILGTSIVGATLHARAGRVVWKIAFVTGGVGIVAAFVGAQVALSMDEGRLGKIFAVVMAILAVRMARNAWTLRSESVALDRGGDTPG